MEQQPTRNKYPKVKALWLEKGVNIGKDGNLRCPHCNWILAEGKYPSNILRFICPKCHKGSTFQRLPK